MRADQLLLERGLASSRSQAQRLIGAGVRWQPAIGEGAPWKAIAKNSDDVPADARIELLDMAEARFVSRGGLKLEGALVKTGLDATGAICLDVGQSTGGFTDCLLQRGAAQVVGVDVGHGQLHANMRNDPRVVAIESVNARALTGDDLMEHIRRALMTDEQNDAIPDANVVIPGLTRDPSSRETEPEDEETFEPLFDLIVADLSFISLTLVLPALVPLAKPNAAFLMLVKPQFELQPPQVGKGGIVKDPAHYVEVEQRLRDCCAALGLKVLDWFDSPISGGDGNREFFIHARKP